MSCPFPGMDPYLEVPPNWGDFVPDFLAEIRNVLLEQLFPRYNIRVEEYVGWPLSAKLPTIPIPLGPQDNDAELDLGTAFRDTHDPAIFDRRLPYDEPLQPPPDEKLKKWIDECLAKRRR